MRNYSQLHLTYVHGHKEKIQKILPKRARRSDGCGEYVNASTSYLFQPPLTKDEMTGLTAKLVDLNVKSFSFEDTLSLGKKD